MNSHEPLPGPGGPHAEAGQGTSGAQPAAETGEVPGDLPCWACLVCPECGAVTSEGHRSGCPQFPPAAGPGGD